MREPEATKRLKADAAGVAAAAKIVAAGGLVAFPTETVYGLGADAADDAAVARLYAAKGRPKTNPLILHVSDLEAAERFAVFDAAAERLAERCWPGPLTLVLPRRLEARLSPLATAGLETVALRAPAHPAAQDLLAAVGRPVVAPSANPSGKLSPTTADHVIAGLCERIDAVLDGGPCAVGVESTILRLGDGPPRLLRPGGVAVEALASVLGAEIAVGNVGAPEAPARLEAPGMLASHYAPDARLRLNAAAPAPGEAWLGFGPDPAEVLGPRRNLSPEGDLAAAAARLFADLRALDAALGGAGVIAVAAVPEDGLGRAVNDRLRRAAAPRDA